MVDIALDLTTNDLDRTGNQLNLVTGGAAIRQHISIRLQLFKGGDWFLDPRVGVPYYESILVKGPDLVNIRAIYREVILTVPGTDTLLKFEFEFIAATRKLRLDFDVSTDSGEVLEFRDFIIDV